MHPDRMAASANPIDLAEVVEMNLGTRQRGRRVGRPEPAPVVCAHRDRQVGAENSTGCG